MRLSFLLLCTILVFLAACGQKEVPNTTTDTSATDDQAKVDSLIQNSIYYAWVDHLNIRSLPKTSAPVAAKVAVNTPLTYLGEDSDQKDAILLRGVVYEDYWHQVKTPDGAIGWVFGGAVKRNGEEKGNAPISSTSLDFPYFGKYDLNNWTLKTGDKEVGGDAEIATTVYQRGSQLLEIEKSEMGEYGYRYTYRLLDMQGKLYRERTLSLETDLDNLLSETVIDYSGTPATRYYRSQRLPVSYTTLSSRPMLVDGKWTSEPYVPEVE